MRKLPLLLLLILILSEGEAIAQGANASPLLAVAGITAAAPKPLPLTVAFGDGNSEVSASVIEQLRKSGKFDIFAFSPELPTVTRAVMERKITADVVKNPSDAAKVALIAHALGAKYAVRIQGSVNGSKATVTLELLKIPDGSWTTTAESDIAAGDGPRAAINRNNAISTAVSSAVSQILIEAFGGLPEPKPVIEPPKPEPQVIAPAPSEPRKTTEIQPTRDITAEYNTILKQVDSYVTRGDLRNAVIALRAAINLQPDNAEIRLRLAKLYSDLGMTAEAISECKRALLFSKDSAPIYTQLASFYVAKGSLADAAEQYAQIIRLDPKNIEARLNLGDVNWNLAKPDDAAAAYEAAATADPQNPAPHERLQRLYAARKMYPQAIEHLVEAKSLSGDVGQDSMKKYGVVARVMQDEFNLVMGKLESGKTDYDNGKVTREDFYKDCKDATARIEALATFLSTQTAPKAYKDVHPHGVLATSLLAQAAGELVSYFETEQQRHLDDADLLQSEAKTEMKDFAAGLNKLNAAGQQPVTNPKEGNG